MDVAVAIDRHLVERLLLKIFRGSRLPQQPDAVIEAGLFESPADPEVSDHALGEFGNPLERRDLDRRVRIDWHSSLSFKRQLRSLPGRRLCPVRRSQRPST